MNSVPARQYEWLACELFGGVQHPLLLVTLQRTQHVSLTFLQNAVTKDYSELHLVVSIVLHSVNAVDKF